MLDLLVLVSIRLNNKQAKDIILLENIIIKLVHSEKKIDLTNNTTYLE